MKKTALGLIATLGFVSMSAQAVPMLGGTTTGPDSSFSINFNYINNSTAGETITSLFMDGSTASAFPILWDSIGSLGGQAALVSGIDTQLVTFDFLSSWDPGEIFSLSGVDPDGVPSPAGVTIGQLAGVQVGATFSGGSTSLYEFVDDPTSGAGLRLSSVPEPGTVALLATGLLGFGMRRRKKNQ